MTIILIIYRLTHFHIATQPGYVIHVWFDRLLDYWVIVMSIHLYKKEILELRSNFGWTAFDFTKVDARILKLFQKRYQRSWFVR